MLITRESYDAITTTLKEFSANKKEHLRFFKGTRAALDTVGTAMLSNERVLKLFRDLDGGKFDPEKSQTNAASFLDEGIARCEREIEKVQSIIRSFTREGFNNVTYGLPFLALSNFGRSMDYPYLMLSGIKKNGFYKSDEGKLLDEIESVLLGYERKMVGYIDDDGVVKFERLANFINLFEEYLRFYFDINDFEFASNIDIDQAVGVNLVSMAHYILSCHLGFGLSEEEYINFAKLYLLLKDEQSMSSGGILQFLCQETKRIIEDNKEEFSSRLPNSNKKVSIESKDEYNKPLSDYIKDGVIYRTCDLDKFQVLLDESNLHADRKNELYVQMKNLIGRQKKSMFDKKMDECREEVLSKEELELYRRAQANVATNAISKDIDAIIELMLDDISDEDRENLKDELEPLFEQIRVILEPEVEKVCETIPNVVYYVENVLKPNGEVEEIPRLLKSVLADKKRNSKRCVSTLNKIMNGLTVGDMELKGVKTGDYRVFVKGRDYKVFYTFVGDTVVIIDAMRSTGDEFKAINKLVGSLPFKEFMKSLQSFIYSGGKPDARGYTSLIMDELGGSDSISESKSFKITQIKPE